MKKYVKRISLIAIALVLILTSIACGGKTTAMDSAYVTSNSSSYNKSYDMSMDFAMAESAAYEPGFYDSYETETVTQSKRYDYSSNGTNETSEVFNDSARKLIKTYDMNVETEKFDDLMVAIEARILALGGYVENMNTYNGSLYSYGKSMKSSNITARIPAQNADRFIEFVGENANITNKNLSVSDVTLQYVDTESRKQTYEIEQERLLALLDKAESIEDIITIESRLSEVRYKLENMASQLRTYDNLVDYSTIYIYVNEVQKYTEPEPETYGERIVRTFTNSVERVWNAITDFFVDFIGAIPGLIIWAVIIFVVVIVFKAIIKKHKKKKAAKAEASAYTTEERKANE